MAQIAMDVAIEVLTGGAATPALLAEEGGAEVVEAVAVVGSKAAKGAVEALEHIPETGIVVQRAVRQGGRMADEINFGPVGRAVPNEINFGGAGRTVSNEINFGRASLAVSEELRLSGQLSRSQAWAVFNDIVRAANARLGANPGLAQTVLSPLEYAAGQGSRALARLQYGNALERLIAQEIRNDSLYREMFEHIAAAGKPDFLGRGPAGRYYFDVFTRSARQITAHRNRPYGAFLSFGTYQRPSTFTVFQ